jgi:hypothetical protein
MRLLLANEIDNELSVRRVDGSVDATLGSRVTVIAVKNWSWRESRSWGGAPL